MNLQIPEYAEKVLDALENAGYEAWFVGGCVRDGLLGREIHDFDIASNARPEQVQALFEKTILTGAHHGTVTVLMDGHPVEVTTFRTEGAYQDHRHPDQVEFVDDIRLDLARRDFTVNAMAWHPERGLLDPFGGQKDLQAGLIRAVGDPALRFEEDALRMFRAFRFAARLGFAIEENTLDAIHAKEELSASLAAERIVPEMEGIFEADPQIIRQMTGLLRPWIPEIEIMRDCEQDSPYHYTDVLGHTLDAMSALNEKGWYSPVRAWALLLHDSGKPEVKQHYGGKDHFKKHELASAKIAARVVRKLKLSSAMQREIPKLVELHDTFYACRPKNLYTLRVMHSMSDAWVQDLFAVQYGDIQAHKTRERWPVLQEFMKWYEEQKKALRFSVKDLPVNGHDVMERTGWSGPLVSQALEQLLYEWDLNPAMRSRQALLERLDNLKPEDLNAPVLRKKEKNNRENRKTENNEK